MSNNDFYTNEIAEEKEEFIRMIKEMTDEEFIDFRAMFLEFMKTLNDYEYDEYDRYDGDYMP